MDKKELHFGLKLIYCTENLFASNIVTCE